MIDSEFEKYIGAAGIATFLRAPFARRPEGADVVVLGNPFDSGTSNRPGARSGPRAMREESLHIGAYPILYPWDYPLLERCRVVDCGDAVGVWGAGATEAMIKAQYEAAREVFAARASLLVLGGDHTGPYGPMRAAAEVHGPLSIVHIDAHQDAAETDGEINHGTFAWDLVQEGVIDDSRSVQVYIRTRTSERAAQRFHILFAEEAIAMGPKAVAGRIREVVGDRPVYVTFDVDGIDPSCTPGTGTPVWGGPSVAEARRMLWGLRGLDIVAADVVEVAPMYDAPNHMTAVAGATIAIDLIYLMHEARCARLGRAPHAR